MEHIDKCYFGTRLNQECHLTSYTNKIGNHNLKDFSQEKVKILFLRAFSTAEQLLQDESKQICYHHHAKFFEYFASKQDKCCDPWGKHSSAVKNSIREIQLDLSENCKLACQLDLIPGKKLCLNCCKSVDAKIEAYSNEYMRCADPNGRHRTPVVDNLKHLSLELVDYLNKVKNSKLNSQHKICIGCELILVSTLSEDCKLKIELPSTSNKVFSQPCLDSSSESQSVESSQSSCFESNS